MKKEVIAAHKRGQTIRQIARVLDINRVTVTDIVCEFERKKSDRRRSRVIIALTIVGVLVVLGFMVNKTQPTERVQHFDQSSQKEYSEEDLDEIITTLENRFLSFGDTLRPHFGEITDEWVRERIDMPFQVVDFNRENGRRNFFAMLKSDSEKTGKAMLDHPDHFVYTLFGLGGTAFRTERMTAGFLPLQRMIALDPEVGDANIIDLLVFYHESYHVTQDTFFRSQISNDEEFRFYESIFQGPVEERPKIIIDWELTAYALEIELMDLYLGGRLKGIVSGFESDPGGVTILLTKELGGREDQYGVVHLLARIAHSYYPERMSLGAHTMRYADTVAENYTHVQLLTRDLRTGRLVFYEPQK